ncbi:MAG: hypothetical protein HY247_08380 [archaeon]|nr:MAG: hypothetical protein HY247_08380 [archaeon]
MSAVSGEAGELILPKITESSQLLAALASTGAGFEALGGSSLMLTEPVENSVDSIIQARKAGFRGKGIVRIFIDRGKERVIIVDNGLGFINPRHICEKPFDSLKKYDPDLTGKFARGLQGFRSYCETLRFVTRRRDVPAGEQFRGRSGNTVSLDFRASRPEVEAAVAPDVLFEEWSWGEFNQGAVAFYGDWKQGEFAKIRRERLTRRIERHFGELIRKGEVEILLWEGEDLVAGRKVPRKEFYECKPKDYGEYTKIDVPAAQYNGGSAKGEAVFELYLMPGPKSDRDYRPFLMYKDRPVGDSPIALIGEFAEDAVWNSSYLTGYVRADFCEINELRLALKPGAARDFLYQQLLNVEGALATAIKEHAKGLIDIRRSQEINQLVNKLQSFLKAKKIFDFKIARESGSISTGDDVETLQGSVSQGTDAQSAFPAASGDPAVTGVPVQVEPVAGVIPGGDPGVHTGQTDFGGTGGEGGGKKEGGPGGPGSEAGYGKDGYRDANGELNKLQTVEQQVSSGDAASASTRTYRRRKPRGFNITTQDNEFSEWLSDFDELTSTVIVNSGHLRYKARDNPDDPINKDLLAYLAELYIWEICKLAGRKNSEFPVMDTFLKTKYEFFEVD